MFKTSGITSCIVAWNAEQHIEEALHALQGWTDQIIVIDEGSTAGTVEIAQRYGALVLSTYSMEFDAARAGKCGRRPAEYSPRLSSGRAGG